MSEHDDNTYDAKLAAEDARDAAEAAANMIREHTDQTDERIARGVEAAAGQETLKRAAVDLEHEGWTVNNIEPGRITLTGAPPMNWWVHGTLPFITLFLSLIWTAKEAKKPRGTLTVTLDQLGRVQQRRS